MSRDDKWNVPGSAEYTDTKPVDTVIRSIRDQKARGYWLTRDYDGQICFASDQTGSDSVVLDQDEDGTAIIRYSDASAEFSYDGIHTVRVRFYS